MSTRPVHAVVVAYHGAAQLSDCLAALERQAPITMVDNSSSAEVCVVAEHYGARYIDAGANRGFASGVNVALRALAADESDVLLVNPDAVLRPDTVHKLSEFMQLPENAHVGAASPRLIGAGGTPQRVMWPYPSPWRMWCEAAGLGHLPARRVFAVGTVLLLRREAVDDVGLFDERFFLYAEETDWQMRAVGHGWTSALCGDAVAEHAGAGTSTNARRRELLFFAAQETYVRKWYGPVGWWLYRVAACLGAGVRVVTLTRERRSAAAHRALLYFLGPRRCAARAAE
jgi:GT2 family glycosyltransferase